MLEAGFGKTLIETSVKTANVPKEPDSSLLKSYPVTFFTTVPPDFIISPFPFTPWKPRTWSLALPTLNLLGPAKLQEITPPIDPSLLLPLKSGPKSFGSNANCWLFLSNYLLISFIGVPDFTLM